MSTFSSLAPLVLAKSQINICTLLAVSNILFWNRYAKDIRGADAQTMCTEGQFQATGHAVLEKKRDASVTRMSW